MSKEDKSSEEYWTKEFKRGVLKLVILGLLINKERYGYELVKLLKDKSDNLLATEEGTVYPLLHRLEKDKFLTTETKNPDGGRMKKYYIITLEGKEAYETGLKTWGIISEGTKKILEMVFEETKE